MLSSLTQSTSFPSEAIGMFDFQERLRVFPSRVRCVAAGGRERIGGPLQTSHFYLFKHLLTHPLFQLELISESV